MHHPAAQPAPVRLAWPAPSSGVAKNRSRRLANPRRWKPGSVRRGAALIGKVCHRADVSPRHPTPSPPFPYVRCTHRPTATGARPATTVWGKSCLRSSPHGAWVPAMRGILACGNTVWFMNCRRREVRVPDFDNAVVRGPEGTRGPGRPRRTTAGHPSAPPRAADGTEPVRRGRGRPKGSKNKPKEQIGRAHV